MSILRHTWHFRDILKSKASFCVTERDIGHCFIRVAGMFSACLPSIPDFSSSGVCLSFRAFPSPLRPLSIFFRGPGELSYIYLSMIILKPWDAFAATLVPDAESNQIYSHFVITRNGKQRGGSVFHRVYIHDRNCQGSGRQRIAERDAWLLRIVLSIRDGGMHPRYELGQKFTGPI